MASCRQQLLIIALVALTGVRCLPTQTQQFVVITEDVIPDIENTTQKVIRVNPLELPSKDDVGMDSSLIKIQSLRRNYTNSNQMRRTRPAADSHIVRNIGGEPKFVKDKRQLAKQQNKLHFYYDQANMEGQDVSKSKHINISAGAYPVYYVLAKTNGRFGKFPIKNFGTQAEFMKYLLKSKAEPIEREQRFER